MDENKVIALEKPGEEERDALTEALSEGHFHGDFSEAPGKDGGG